MTEAERIYEIMKTLAAQNNVVMTDNALKIAEFRAKRNIPIEKCPCDVKDSDRGCISRKCLSEINETGVCHCNCFKKCGE